MSRESNVKIKVNREPELNGGEAIDRQVLAAHIIEISRAFTKLTSKGGLSKRAVIILVANHAKVSFGTTRVVLESLDQLQDWAIAK